MDFLAPDLNLRYTIEILVHTYLFFFITFISLLLLEQDKKKNFRKVAVITPRDLRKANRNFVSIVCSLSFFY